MEGVEDDGEGKGDEFTPATVVSDLEVPRRKRTISLEPSTDRPVKLQRQLVEEDPKMMLLSRRDFKARREDQSRRESQSRSRSESMAPGPMELDEVVTTTTITTTTTLTTTAAVNAEPVNEEPVELKINGMTVICID